MAECLDPKNDVNLSVIQISPYAGAMNQEEWDSWETFGCDVKGTEWWLVENFDPSEAFVDYDWIDKELYFLIRAEYMVQFVHFAQENGYDPVYKRDFSIPQFYFELWESFV